MGLLPIMLISMFTAGFLFYIFMKKGSNIDRFWHWFVVMSICVIYFTHPTLSRAVMSIYICIEIDSGEYWLASDLSVRCWTGDHYTLSLLVGLPFGIFWIIIVPCLAFYYLYRRKKLLTNKYF